MEPTILNDKLLKPNDEIVFAIIGDKKVLWEQIRAYLNENQKDIFEEWKYYNDGKSWLFRVLKKKKTLFWIRVLDNTFRVGFWFGDKAEAIIEQSDLSSNLKEDFKNAKRYGLIRSLSIEMHHSGDLENVIKLIEIKLKVK
jgi:hypothetical protein